MWPFCNAEEGDREFITTNIKKVENGPLEGKFIVTDDDPDLPENAKDGGYIATEGAKFNPGQLVLAIAEQVQRLGGCIVTSCKVEEVSDTSNGKITLQCNYRNRT